MRGGFQESLEAWEEVEAESGALLDVGSAGLSLLLDWRKDKAARKDLWRVRERALTALVVMQVRWLRTCAKFLRCTLRAGLA